MLHKTHSVLSSQTIAIFTSALLLGVAIVTLASPTAGAIESEHYESARTPDSSSHDHDSRTNSKTATVSTDRRIAANEKLTAAKLKACEKRESNVNSRTERIAERANKHLDVFTKISDRVQAFYVTKGYSVENYDALVAEVNAAKTAAEASVAEIANQKGTFNCDEAPKQSLQTFKESLKSSTAALRTYRTSIKNLIVAVKSANSTSTQNATSTNNTAEEMQ